MVLSPERAGSSRDVFYSAAAGHGASVQTTGKTKCPVASLGMSGDNVADASHRCNEHHVHSLMTLLRLAILWQTETAVPLQWLACG